MSETASNNVDPQTGEVLEGRISLLRTSLQYEQIYAALVDAQGRMGAIPKSGFNTYDNYKYAALEDFVGVVQPALKASKLFLLATLKNVVRPQPAATKNGGIDNISIVTLALHLGHVSGQWLEIEVIGEGRDRGDKSLYKAYTGARKYGISNLFNLATETDPERTEAGAGSAPTTSSRDRNSRPAQAAAPRGRTEPPATTKAAEPPLTIEKFKGIYFETMESRGYEVLEAGNALETLLAKRSKKLEELNSEMLYWVLNQAQSGRMDIYAKASPNGEAPPANNSAPTPPPQSPTPTPSEDVSREIAEGIDAVTEKATPPAEAEKSPHTNMVEGIQKEAETWANGQRLGALVEYINLMRKKQLAMVNNAQTAEGVPAISGATEKQIKAVATRVKFAELASKIARPATK